MAIKRYNKSLSGICWFSSYDKTNRSWLFMVQKFFDRFWFRRLSLWPLDQKFLFVRLASASLVLMVNNVLFSSFGFRNLFSSAVMHRTSLTGPGRSEGFLDGSAVL